MAQSVPKKAAKKAVKKAAKKQVHQGRTTQRNTPTVEQLSYEDVTDVSAFKSEVLGVPTRFPSGKVMVVRNPGMQAFLTAGMIPNSLMPYIEEGMKKGEVSQKKITEDAQTNPEMLQDILALADSVAMYCITKPEVHAIPHFTAEDASEGRCSPEEIDSKIPFHRRDQGKLYVDEITLEDKMFVFQFAVGGTRDLERFRQELD